MRKGSERGSERGRGVRGRKGERWIKRDRVRVREGMQRRQNREREPEKEKEEKDRESEIKSE